MHFFLISYADPFILSLLSCYILVCSPMQVRNYYSFKYKHCDIYDDLMPSKEQNIFKHNILVVLPVRDQLGRRILLLELGSE